ncbi:MAG: hypothetical protein IPP34_17015 [Bacteroidetes bacterium]|nr:hypothetical protein [Bacteroidota bacterium]
MAIRVTIFDDNKRLLDSLSVLIDGSSGFRLGTIQLLRDLFENKSTNDVILRIQTPHQWNKEMY